MDGRRRRQRRQRRRRRGGGGGGGGGVGRPRLEALQRVQRLSTGTGHRRRRRFVRRRYRRLRRRVHRLGHGFGLD